MSPLLRKFTHTRFVVGNIRQLSISAARSNTATVGAPTASAKKPRKPVGGVRGALFGFLLGTTVTGLFGYYYVLDVYRDSNSLLLEDLLHLQRHVSKVEERIKELEAAKK
ncbi:hypothetical protein V1505DRAFT_362410 [Lipomyces doorenjongii]|uniref:uncharacterized protein n=1 Tax=Lipomyces doorenjongii TaxID=383834 RepID=UPI0033432823